MTCGPTLVVQKPQRPVEVTEALARTTTVREALNTTSITRTPRETVVARSRRDTLVQRPVVRVIDLVETGPQGPRGAPGGTIAPIAFAYGDAPTVVYIGDAPGTYTKVRVDITTPFDGANPGISIGVVGDIDALMSTGDNDPLTQAAYETTPDYHVAGATGVWLEITPDGSTQGAGVLYLEFYPD